MPAVHEAEITITDYSGHKLLTYQFDKTSNKFDVDISSLNAGMYFLTLIADGKKIKTEKLILTK